MTLIRRVIKGRCLVVAICIFSIMLSGCQTTAVDLSKLTPEERQLRLQKDEFNKTVVEGAIAGAIVGALLGAMLSSRRDRGRGAAIGGAAGATMGASAGYYVASQKDAYSNKLSHLDKMIKDVGADNTRLIGYMATTEKVITDNKNRIEVAEQKIASGQAKKESLNEELQRAEGNKEVIGETLAKLKTNHKEYINASSKFSSQNPGADKSQLDSQIADLQSNIYKLEGEYEELTRLLQAHRLG